MTERDEYIRKSDQMLFDLKDKIDKIYSLLIGNGTEDNPGVLVRVDRLEQSENYRQKKAERAWQRSLALWGTVGGLIIERAIHYMKHGGN